MTMTIQELATSNATDYSTSNISNLQGKIWLDKVIQYGETKRRFDQAAIINTDLVNSPDKTAAIPKSTSSLDVTVSTTENTAPTYTELTNLNTVDVTVSSSDFKRGGIAISKQILMTSRVDLIKQARYVIGNAMAEDVDEALAGTNCFQDSNVSKVLTGGASDVSGLSTGDTITTDAVANAMAQIETNDFQAMGGRLYISPEHQKAFRKDSKFTNASEYGSRKVIERGQIGDYLGVKIIVTNNVPGYSSGDTDTHNSSKTWGAAGHSAVLVGVNNDNENVSGVLVWKEKPTIGYEYHKEKAEHRIFYDQAYVVDMIQPDAVCLIKATNS